MPKTTWSEVYEATGEVRWALATLLGRMDAALKFPECSPTPEEIHEYVKRALELASKAHDVALWSL